jgi:hypothetical protein
MAETEVLPVGVHELPGAVLLESLQQEPRDLVVRLRLVQRRPGRRDHVEEEPEDVVRRGDHRVGGRAS